MQTVPKSILIIFIVLLLCPTLDWFWRIDPFSYHNENRKLAERPTIPRSLESLQKFPKEFQSYFNDNFGFRNLLVRGNYFIKYRLLGVSPSSQVLIGKNGWLFNTGDGEIEDYRRITRFTEEQLRRWTLNLELKKMWLEQQGIRYLLVVAPNKSTIYPEFLPDSYSRVRDVSAIDEFLEYVRKKTHVDVIDLREKLTSAKSTETVYFKTDTHWNNYGAFVAYSEIIKPIATWFPKLIPLKFDDFSIEKKREASGDLAGMIGGLEFLSDDQYNFTPKKTFTTTLVEKNKKQRDPFTIEKNDNRLPRAVIFRDSFFTALVPFIAENFRGSRYYWQRWDAQTPMVEIIGRHRPDIVIEEVVERNFKSEQNDFGKQLPPYMNSLFKSFDVLKQPNNGIVVNDQVVLTKVSGGLRLKVTGIDPQMVLPQLSIPSTPDVGQIVNVVIESPNDTHMQVFYSLKKHQDYSEDRSIRIPLKKGHNQFQVPMLQQGGIVGRIRLDPADKSGDYLLKVLEIHRVNSDFLKKW